MANVCSSDASLYKFRYDKKEKLNLQSIGIYWFFFLLKQGWLDKVGKLDQTKTPFPHSNELLCAMVFRLKLNRENIQPQLSAFC